MGFVLALLAVIAFVWLGVSDTRGGGPPLVGFPFEIIDARSNLATNGPASTEASTVSIFPVMDHGKWVCVRTANDAAERGDSTRYFYDTGSRRFVAKLVPYQTAKNGVCHPELSSPLQLDRVIVRQVRVDQFKLLAWYKPWAARYDSYFYELDVATSKTRFLAHHKESGAALLGRTGLPNRGHTHMVYADNESPRLEFVIFDLRDGSSRALKRRHFGMSQGHTLRPWGWLADDRTILFLEDWSTSTLLPPGFVVENLHLVDVQTKKGPRNVAPAERFKESMAKGKLAPGEDTLLACLLLTDRDGGRRLRLVAAFGADGATSVAEQARWSVWDLDRETERLTRVMDLPLGLIRHHAEVGSPSGDTIVSALPPEPRGGMPLADAVVYRVGQPPLRLPFKLYKHCWGLPDDHTLVYTNGRDEIWRFDLRTSQSELLWSPSTR